MHTCFEADHAQRSGHVKALSTVAYAWHAEAVDEGIDEGDNARGDWLAGGTRVAVPVPVAVDVAVAAVDAGAEAVDVGAVDLDADAVAVEVAGDDAVELNRGTDVDDSDTDEVALSPFTQATQRASLAAM